MCFYFGEAQDLCQIWQKKCWPSHQFDTWWLLAQWTLDPLEIHGSWSWRLLNMKSMSQWSQWSQDSNPAIQLWDFESELNLLEISGEGPLLHGSLTAPSWLARWAMRRCKARWPMFPSDSAWSTPDGEVVRLWWRPLFLAVVNKTYCKYPLVN
jgi:hypothetical protein